MSGHIHGPLWLNRVVTWLTSLIRLALVCGVGYSRIYLHVHFPSDVAAGLLLSTFWITGVAFFCTVHRPQHIVRRSKRGALPDIGSNQR
jgi:membrane-associated phospholipid phosphatase